MFLFFAGHILSCINNGVSNEMLKLFLKPNVRLKCIFACMAFIFSSIFSGSIPAVLPSITIQTQWILSFKAVFFLKPGMSEEMGADGLN